MSNVPSIFEIIELHQKAVDSFTKEEKKNKPIRQCGCGCTVFMKYGYNKSWQCSACRTICEDNENV